MTAKFTLRPYLVRFLIVLVISTVFTALFNEATFLLQKEEHDRAPKTIQLVIPAGTAEQVEQGQSVPAIPSEMVFVVGDVLEVKNEDDTSHQLGPVWVPPGATGRLVMERADKLAYSCSFQTSRYLGVDIRQATTWGTRLTALSLATPTLAALLFLYSLVAFPVRSSKDPEAPGEQAASGKV